METLTGLANNLGIMDTKADLIRFYETQPRRANGESQYLHIQRVSEILKNASPTQELSAGFELGILIHDMVDRSINSTNQTEIDENTNALTLLLRRTAKTSPHMAAYAYGIALSSCEYEKAARRWRRNLAAAISYQDEPELLFLRQQITEIDATDGENNLPTKLTNVLKHQSNEPVDDELRRFISPAADLEDLVYMHNLYDIEGLKIAAAGMIDNSRYPRNDASHYKDSQELLSFIGPLLELAGMNDIARQCYSTAYEFIYAQSPHMPRARELYQYAIECESSPNFQYRITNIITGFIQHKLTQLGIESNIFLSSRKKKPGSIAKKLNDKKVYGMLNNVPDLIAQRTILDNSDITATQMMEIAQELVLTLQQVNPDLIPEHINPEDPCIQANYEGLEPLSQLDTIKKYHYSTSQGGPRNEGYEAFHINWQLPLSAITDKKEHEHILIPYELQLLQETKHIENTYGLASHMFYKMRNAFGKAGEACRKFFANPKENRAEFESMVKSYRHQFERIFERANYFRNHLNNKGVKDYKLTPHVIETVRNNFENMGIILDDNVYRQLRLNSEKRYYEP